MLLLAILIAALTVQAVECTQPDLGLASEVGLGALCRVETRMWAALRCRPCSST